MHQLIKETNRHASKQEAHDGSSTKKRKSFIFCFGGGKKKQGSKHKKKVKKGIKIHQCPWAKEPAGMQSLTPKSRYQIPESLVELQFTRSSPQSVSSRVTL